MTQNQNLFTRGFELLAESLVSVNGDRDRTVEVMAELIRVQMADGWDGYKSLLKFRETQAVVEAFGRNGVTLKIEDRVPVDIDGLTELLRLAQVSPGTFPWQADGCSLDALAEEKIGGGYYHYAYVDGASRDQVKLIAEVSQALPGLLEELGELRARIKGLEK